MPSKAKVKVTKVRTTTTAKVGKSRNKSDRTNNVIRRRKENIVVALQGTENNGIYRRRVRNVRSNS